MTLPRKTLPASSLPPDTLATTAAPPCRDDPPAALDSQALLHGASEVLIRHGDETYRLRQTQSGKLILTK